jgi:hypothetical protein
MNKSFIYILLSAVLCIMCKLQIRVMQTSILKFFPQLKLHHLVLISKVDEMERYSYVYAIDFTPINQSHPKTFRRLLLGKNVPAELRIRRLQNINIRDDKTILKMWDSNLSDSHSRELSNSVYTSIQDKEIKETIALFLRWEKNKQYMNLYTRNCQHFGNYAKSNHLTYMEQQ